MLRMVLVAFTCFGVTSLPGSGGRAEDPAARPVPPMRAGQPKVGGGRPLQLVPNAPSPYAGLPLGGGDGGESISGTVTAVDGVSITVAADEQRITQYTHDLVRGHVIAEKLIIIPPQPPRQFVAVGSLAEGSYLKNGKAGRQYRLADVKVGDKVWFDWRLVGDVAEVHYVSIFRRPGGKVPPSPAEKLDEKNPWHERCNAFQNLEEKGIPLPEKFRPKPVEPPPPIPPIPSLDRPTPPRIPPAKD